MICPACNFKFVAQSKQRSNPENRYYWGVVIALLSDLTGFSDEEMHEILKKRFLSKTVLIHDSNGMICETVEIGKSTARLTTIEFEDYLSKIREWASTLGCDIPIPNEGETNEALHNN
jgi:hypothetical protein